jgi:hypothetical protein
MVHYNFEKQTSLSSAVFRSNPGHLQQTKTISRATVLDVRESSVGIVTRYGLNERSSIPVGSRDVFFFRVQTGSEAHPVSYAMSAKGCRVYPWHSSAIFTVFCSLYVAEQYRTIN